MQLPLQFENEYILDFLSSQEASSLYAELRTYLDQHIDLSIGDNTFSTSFEKVMFLEDSLYSKKIFNEAIWGKTAPFSKSLLQVKEAVEEMAKRKFPVCVAIFYPDGNSGVGFHADYVAFGDTSIIVSISLGAERVFKFREKETGLEYGLTLHNGSLLVMGNPCQELYEHSLPEDPHCTSGRINLTFRQYGYPRADP
jgi:alkylated DNA repair dioxygenase AlkB